MGDYIKREDALHALCVDCAARHIFKRGLKCSNDATCKVFDRVSTLPAADVRENEYTTDKNGTPSLFECEKCGWEDWDTYTGDGFVYCPGCGRKIKSGADMRG